MHERVIHKYMYSICYAAEENTDCLKLMSSGCLLKCARDKQLATCSFAMTVLHDQGEHHGRNGVESKTCFGVSFRETNCYVPCFRVAKLKAEEQLPCFSCFH